MLKRLLLAAVLVLISHTVAQAACTGSSPSWSTTGDQSSVQTCLTNASSGDTITVTSNSTWTGTVAGSAPVISPSGKSLTIQGTGYTVDGNGRATSTNITLTNGVGVDTYMLRVVLTTGQYVRITGITFDANNNEDTYATIGFTGGGASNAQHFRVDHIVLPNDVGRGIITEPTGGNVIYGNIDHNTMSCPIPPGGGGCQDVTPLGPTQESAMFSTVTLLGAANNLFVENNTIAHASRNDGCVEAYNGTRFVMRFNTVHTCLQGSHGADSSDGRGPMTIEVYNNDFDMVGCDMMFSGCDFGMMQFRSGMMVIFKNTWTAEYSLYAGYQGINLDIYRAWDGSTYTYLGGPCNGSNPADGNEYSTHGRHCIDSFGTLFTDTLDGTHSHYPMYMFENKQGATMVHADSNNIAGNVNVVIYESDVFNPIAANNPQSCTTNAPIGNGTCGTGYGTHAQRPATCTGPDGEGQGGVGYWETDTGGDWDLTNASANDGQLFRCTATNTWTSYYIPYTYPYPGTSDDDVPVNFGSGSRSRMRR